MTFTLLPQHFTNFKPLLLSQQKTSTVYKAM